MSKQEIIGYKATYNYICRKKKYKVGQTYSMKESPIICERGFHFCQKASDVLNYYEYNSEFKLLLVKSLGDVDVCYDKVSTNKIEILSEITDPDELFNLLNLYRKYDKDETLVYCKEKTFNNEILISYVKKNKKGLITEEKSRYGSITKHKYNSSNELIETKLNDKIIFKAKFDKENREIYRLDNDLIHTTTYNSSGKIVETSRLDGSLKNRSSFILIKNEYFEVENLHLDCKIQFKTNLFKTYYKNGKLKQVKTIDLNNNKEWKVVIKDYDVSGNVKKEVFSYISDNKKETSIFEMGCKISSLIETKTIKNYTEYAPNGSVIYQKIEDDFSITEKRFKK